jgi:hypothetical protein
MQRSLFRRAVELDPSFARLMKCGLDISLQIFSDGRAETLGQALAHAKKALSLDENDARCRWALGSFTHSCTSRSRWLHLSKAVALNPTMSKLLAGMPLMARWAELEALEKLDIAVTRSFPP